MVIPKYLKIRVILERIRFWTSIGHYFEVSSMLLFAVSLRPPVENNPTELDSKGIKDVYVESD